MARKKKQGNFMTVMNELLGLNDEFDLDLDDLENEEAEADKGLTEQLIEPENTEEDKDDLFYKKEYEKEEALIRSELAEAVRQIDAEEEATENSEVTDEEKEVEELLGIVEEFEKEYNEDVTDDSITNEEIIEENEDVEKEENEEKEVDDMAVQDINLNKGEECAIINKSMVVDGNIKSDSSIMVHGTVNGNIECSGHLFIDGTVTGNVDASTLTVEGGKITGNVHIVESTVIKDKSEIHGDIIAADLKTNAYIDGKIRANKVALLSKAVVNGDIEYEELAIEAGAKLKGALSTFGE